MDEVEVVVVGAGLGGLAAAIRLGQLGHECYLVDESLPDAKGQIGGFAKFSGAKFSFPPAGLGLLDVVASEQELWLFIEKVLDLLGLAGLQASTSHDHAEEVKNLRRYDSIVLTPTEINSLLNKLNQHLSLLPSVKVIKGKCEILSLEDKNFLRINTAESSVLIKSDSVFYAGGRLGGNMLEEHGVEPTNIKGLDVGFRVEFKGNSGLDELRRLGPDAKIISGRCRTFCLNVPGEIYRYPYGDISIPGGVVANIGSSNHNVGILYRADNKSELLARIRATSSTVPLEQLEKAYFVKEAVFGPERKILIDMYGEKILSSLESFCHYLESSGLVDWKNEHYIHLPLIDWHWKTFSLEGKFETNKKRIYCIGDSSGHARGLLQAAVSGWIAAEEYNHATQK